MQGAQEYATMFSTGQYGKLYLVSGQHARGRTFRIFVLPANVEAVPNGKHNPPLNADSVEVYGVICGNPGLTEAYGWLHRGRWEHDFAALIKARKAEIDSKLAQFEHEKAEAEKSEKQRTAELLAAY